jgi:hypothetical protein
VLILLRDFFLALGNICFPFPFIDLRCFRKHFQFISVLRRFLLNENFRAARSISHGCPNDVLYFRCNVDYCCPFYQGVTHMDLNDLSTIWTYAQLPCRPSFLGGTA